MPVRSRHADPVSRRIKLRQLEVLMAVAETGNMAKAAKTLAISQPVVSKTIANLEYTVGKPLFDRSRRGAALTLYGEALLKRSVGLFNDLRAGVAELEALADPGAGHLRIGSSEAVAAGMLGAIIDRLARHHPRLSFEVTLGAGLVDMQYRALQMRDLDLVIGRLASPVPDDVAVETLYEDPAFVVCAAHHPWARRRKIAPADLIAARWCLPALENYPWSLTAEAFQARGLPPPHRVVTTRSIPLLLSLIETGRFLSVLPRTVLAFRPEPLRLKVLPADLDLRSYPVGIATLRSRTPSPALQFFAQAARDSARTFTAGK